MERVYSDVYSLLRFLPIAFYSMFYASMSYLLCRFYASMHFGVYKPTFASPFNQAPALFFALGP